MIDPAGDSAVLRPASVGAAGEALRRRLNRRHLLEAAGIAILFHLLIILGFWLVDRVKVRDIGDWSGPVLVKIGVPDAPDSPAVDPGPLPEQEEETVKQEETPAEPENMVSPDAVETPLPEKSENNADTVQNPENKTAEETTTPEAAPAPAAVPSRVRGEESGNSYEMNFDGTEGEVGRVAAYDYITSYMPLPEVLDASLIEGITGTDSMPPDFILGELERYWELDFGDYVKKPGSAGTIPLNDRPYYWSLIVNYLGYNPENADWRQPGMRPVVVEFTVNPSEGARGAELSDIKLKTRTNDPRIDEAVIYGISRWVYYNDTGNPVKGRITYRFDK